MATISKARLKKLAERKKKLKESSSNNGLLFIKADETIRARILPVDADSEFGKEIIQFYFNAELKGLISPKSIGLKCPVMELYEDLKSSKDEDDQELAGRLKPKSKYVIPVIVKKDKLGKEVDEQKGVRLLLVPKGVYQDLIDLFMDDDHGDFTDPKEGYDIKFIRTGSTMTDTEYKVMTCKPSPLPKKYNKIYDVDELLTKEVPSYEDAKSTLDKFLGVDEDDEDKPRKKKKPMKRTKADVVKKKKKKLG